MIVDGGMRAVIRRRLGKNAGLQETVLFGRNELALHHHHSSYRAALDMVLSR
ncbi:MAG: hypothetical protein ACC649_08110 [Myxococcota bacterium]